MMLVIADWLTWGLYQMTPFAVLAILAWNAYDKRRSH